MDGRLLPLLLVAVTAQYCLNKEASLLKASIYDFLLDAKRMPAQPAVICHVGGPALRNRRLSLELHRLGLQGLWKRAPLDKHLRCSWILKLAQYLDSRSLQRKLVIRHAKLHTTGTSAVTSFGLTPRRGWNRVAECCRGLRMQFLELQTPRLKFASL